MPLTVYLRGEVWHYRGTVVKGGRRLRGSTGATEENRAREYAANIETQEWKRHHHGPEAVLRFSDAATLYRQSEKPTRFLSKVEDYWKDTLVKHINSGAVRQAAVALYPKRTGATRNRNFVVPTQAIINHAAKLDLCPHLKVERFPVVKKEKQPVTWVWVKKFMAVASPHLGALACFMFLTGARISEATELTWGDVDLNARRATITMGKLGGETRRAHLPAPLVAALASIPSNRDADEKVFRFHTRYTCKTQWRAATKRAKIPFLSYHACRHGFATAMLHKGVDPITTAKLGGWKDPKHVFTTYGHAQEDDTLADAIVDTPVAQIVTPAQKSDNNESLTG